MKNLYSLLLILAMLSSCDNTNQKELSDLRAENERLRQMIGSDSLENESMTAMKTQQSDATPSSALKGKMIDKKDFDKSKVKFEKWKGEAKKLDPKVKKGIYPRYYFMGLEKMNYMVENSYLYNQGKDTTDMIKGFAMTMGLKDKVNGEYIFDLMIVPQIDSLRFLLIDPPKSTSEKDGGAFGDGSILDDMKPCPDDCNGAS